MRENYKDDFTTKQWENKCIHNKCYIYKDWFSVFSSKGKSGISLIWRSLTGLPFSNNFMQAMPPRQKNMVHLCRSLHLPQTWAKGGIVCRVVWTCPRKLPTLGQVPLKMRFSWPLPHTASPPPLLKMKIFWSPPNFSSSSDLVFL